MNYTVQAQQYIANGFSVLPVVTDGSKSSLGPWKAYQQRFASEHELEQWFGTDHPCGIGVVAGPISGNLHILDFDHEAEPHFQRWWNDAEQLLPGITSKLLVVATPRPGRQVWFRQESVPAKQQVLAWTEPQPTSNVDGTPVLDADGNQVSVPAILIETRGTGNYAVGVGSPAAVHPTGRPYQLIHGSFDSLPMLTDAEADTLLAICRQYSRYQPQHVQRQAGETYQGEPRPGDVFNELTDPRQLLTTHNWQLHHIDGNDVEHWTRPGKPLAAGTSATLGALQTDDGKPLFYVFSGAALPFEEDHTYDTFAVYAMLEHGGDFATAAAAVRIRYSEQVQAAQVAWKQATAPEPAAYVPFPTELLPDVVRTYVDEHAQAIGIDPAFVAVPMLAVLAALIGQARRVYVKRNWTEPSILWTATVADVSTGKTPGWQAATEPAQRIERMLNEQRKQLDLQYQKELAEYQANNKEGNKPTKPTYNKQLTVDDCTMETLAELHQNNWHGLLLSVDELAGWLKSFDQYRAGKGRDVENWLSIYNGKSMQVNRRTDGYRMYLPSTAVSVCGTIQPQVAASTLFSERFVDNGFAARILSAMPPAKIVRWSEREVPEQVDDAMYALARELYLLAGEQYQTDLFRSIVLPFTDQARNRFIRYLNDTADHAEPQEPALRASWLKLRPAAARFALVFSIVQQLRQYPDGKAMQAVDEQSTAAGIELAWWFGRELERNYRNGMQSGRSDTLESHLAWIRSNCPSGVDARQLQQSRRSIQTADQARNILQQMLDAGHGRLAGTVFIPR
jgi:hypothetical protein